MSAVIAVIGCGNIGSRALQAVAQLDPPATIRVVDPVLASLARARVAELGSAAAANVVYAESMSGLLEAIDQALIATCADTRRATVEALLDRAGVRFLILEKFLFQRADDYAAVGERFAKSGTRCWVNLVRRAWPGRWGVEIATRNHRLFLQPLEGLRVQRTGSMTVEPATLDDDLDTRCKPGLHRQLAAFLTCEGADALLPIEAHAKPMSVYGQIWSGTGGRALKWAPARVRA